MSLSRTFSQINGNFRRKSQISPPPCITPRPKGFPLEYGIDARDRFSRLDTIPAYDRQTDRQTLHDGNDRAMHAMQSVERVKTSSASELLRDHWLRQLWSTGSRLTRAHWSLAMCTNLAISIHI